jgi:hypothetical protein
LPVCWAHFCLVIKNLDINTCLILCRVPKVLSRSPHISIKSESIINDTFSVYVYSTKQVLYELLLFHHKVKNVVGCFQPQIDEGVRIPAVRLLRGKGAICGLIENYKVCARLWASLNGCSRVSFVMNLLQLNSESRWFIASPELAFRGLNLV